MEIWQLLGIDKTHDIRTIKRAYARQLKQTPPDEMPREFQELHHAYKAALHEARLAAYETKQVDQANAQAETVATSAPATAEADQENSQTTTVIAQIQQTGTSWQAEAVNDTGIEDNDISNTDNIVNPIAHEENQPSNEAEPPDPRHDAYEQALKEVDEILESPSRMHNLKSWHFLERNTFILDDEFNWQLGLAIMQRFVAYQEYYNGTERRYSQISTAILVHLDTVFNWLVNSNYLYQAIEADNLTDILERIDDNAISKDPLASIRGSKHIELATNNEDIPLSIYHSGNRKRDFYYGSGTKRFAALAIDIFIIAYPLNKIFAQIKKSTSPIDADLVYFQDMKLLAFISAFFLMTWLFESSRAQATPGMIIFQLKATNKQYQRLSYLHGFFRTLAFLLTCIGNYITLIINTWSKGIFLHDRLSRSYVIDFSVPLRQRFQKKQKKK